MGKNWFGELNSNNNNNRLNIFKEKLIYNSWGIFVSFSTHSLLWFWTNKENFWPELLKSYPICGYCKYTLLWIKIIENQHSTLTFIWSFTISDCRLSEEVNNILFPLFWNHIIFQYTQEWTTFFILKDVNFFTNI